MLRIFRNNHIILPALTALLPAFHPAIGYAQAGNPAVAHLQYALIGDFKLENGRSIDQCTIAYQTFGKLNREKNNVVLFPTWFTGTSMNLLPFVPGKMIDTNRFFLILVDALGDGLSSSPSNSQTQPGIKFPAFSIRDMVESQHVFLTAHLHIDHLYAVSGVSMGGMQSFQWAVSYPGFEIRSSQFPVPHN
ncbi:MAG TPA: alpha/beta fold hydrolase [Puia sp.]|nr:alpha/beta fold hydrolase [Puia sp.]